MYDLTKIKEAIKSGEYKVTFEEPSNVWVRTKYDGSQFYSLSDTDTYYGFSAGFCYVSVLEYNFYCDLSLGDWFLEDHDSDYISDQELVDALESIPGIIKGEILEADQLMEVYYKANPDADNLPYYWDDDKDIPKTIEDLGYDDVEFIVKYQTNGSLDNSEGWKEQACTIKDSGLYKLYLFVKENRKTNSPLPKDEIFEVTSEELKNYNEDLYSVIMEQLLGYTDSKTDIDLCFMVPLNSEIFEKGLL